MSISLNDHEKRIKNIDTQLPNISNRITKLEQSAGAKKEVYIQRFSNRRVNAGGQWASERISEIPAAWQMEACCCAFFSASSSNTGLWAILGKGASWGGGYTSGSRKGNNYNTGVRRTSSQWELFKGDYNNGVNGFIMFYK